MSGQVTMVDHRVVVREPLRTKARHMIPRRKLHGLCQTWATLALREDIDIHVVGDRLAHSTTHSTSETYTHVTRPMQSDAAEGGNPRILGGDTH